MRRAWLLAAPFALVSITPARAADSWLVTEVHGAVLALVGDEWREINSGDRIGSGIAVRTLQAGSAKLHRAGEVIGLAANTVVRPRAANGRPVLEQYTGVVTLLKTGRTGSLVVMPDGGPAPATPPAILYVRGGEAHLTVGGRRLLLKAGQGYSSQGVWEGLTTPDSKGDGPPAAVPAGMPGAPDAASGAPPSAGSATPPGPPIPPGTQAGPAGSDNGVGNGGTPGNGGQNGNGPGGGNAGNSAANGGGPGGGNGNSGKGPK